MLFKKQVCLLHGCSYLAPFPEETAFVIEVVPMKEGSRDIADKFVMEGFQTTVVGDVIGTVCAARHINPAGVRLKHDGKRVDAFRRVAEYISIFDKTHVTFDMVVRIRGGGVKRSITKAEKVTILKAALDAHKCSIPQPLSVLEVVRRADEAVAVLQGATSFMKVVFHLAPAVRDEILEAAGAGNGNNEARVKRMSPMVYGASYNGLLAHVEGITAVKNTMELALAVKFAEEFITEKGELDMKKFKETLKIGQGFAAMGADMHT